MDGRRGALRPSFDSHPTAIQPERGPMTRQIHTTAPSSWGDSRPSAPPRPVTLRFERGTLALEGLEEIGPGLAALDVTWDPRSGFHRAPPWRYGALQELSLIHI